MSNSTEVITGCDPDFESCPAERIDGGNDFEIQEVDGRSTMLWLLVLYYTQLGVIPFLALSMWFRDFKLFDQWWSGTMMWLHAITYLPTSLMGSLYYWFGDSESSFTHLLDDSFVWLMVYFTPNAGLVTHSIGWSVFLTYSIFSKESSNYFILLILYIAFAFYMHFFTITKGVEVIRHIYPLWQGTKSGLLWPALLYMLGMIDGND